MVHIRWYDSENLVILLLHLVCLHGSLCALHYTQRADSIYILLNLECFRGLLRILDDFREAILTNPPFTCILARFFVRHGRFFVAL